MTVEALALLENNVPSRPQKIANRWCLWQRGDTLVDPPPLIVCVGMAQTVQNWAHHLQKLSHDGGGTRRHVLLYQPAGLGRLEDGDDLAWEKDLSLPAQASYLLATIKEAFVDGSVHHPDHPLVVDLAGFSLGGRIVLATAVQLLRQQPQGPSQIQIRKIHLTGVSWNRSEYGRLQIESWKEHLHSKRDKGDLRAFAGSAIRASYSAPYLWQKRHQVESQWIPNLCQCHTAAGLYQLLQQAHHNDDDENEEWSVPAMAQKLVQGTNNNYCKIDGRLLVGREDLMAPWDRVQILAQELQWPVTVIPDVGHAVPLEAPRAWREDVLQHLA